MTAVGVYTLSMKNSTNTVKKNEADAAVQVKKGLALGGGGSRGSYTMGVIKALMETGHSFDIVTGISIGALTGAGFVMQDETGLKAWISSFQANNVVDNPFAFPDAQKVPPMKPDQGGTFFQDFTAGGPSIAPLIEKYGQFFNYDKFMESSIDFACLTYNVTQNKPVVFYKKDMKRETAELQLMCSTAYFPAFNLVSYEGDQYADGSYCDLPLGIVNQDMGGQDIIAVDLHNRSEQPLPTIPNLSLLIHPILDLKYYLDFQPDTLIRQITQGYLEGLKFLNAAPGYIYTFYPEDKLVFDGLNKVTQDVLKRKNIALTNDQIIAGIDALLGYQPGRLDNELMKDYLAGLVLECLGLVAGINPYQQYHIMDFVGQVLDNLSGVNPVLSPVVGSKAQAMEVTGARNLLILFHSGLKSFNGSLPPQFDCFRKKYGSVYYLALVWYILDSFSGIFEMAQKFEALKKKF